MWRTNESHLTTHSSRARSTYLVRAMWGFAALIPAAALSASPASADAVSGQAQLPAAVQQLLSARDAVGLQALPTDGAGALTQAINAVAIDLGVGIDASQTVAGAHLSQALSSRVAVVLEDQHQCDLITAGAVTTL